MNSQNICIFAPANENHCANCLDAFKELEAQYEGLHVVVLSNQGNYISILIKSILTSMLVGAALAIVVLAIFLKDVKPTLVVGVSIPLSVLFAVVLMYFTGLDLNVMTLAGLSLGIGMLVDNSVVVIENIYRLRGRGVPAARAAVQGARQVGMSVVASTLTSVCVFLPAVFSASLIRNLMGPMSLCIGYCLMASLIVALTVVPAASATVLKNAQPKKLAWFDKIQNAYGRSLEKALQKRFVPLAAAVLLLVFCCWRVVSMGIVLLPTSTSNEALITLSTTDTLSKEESYDVAGKVVQAVMAVDGVEEEGITPDNTVAGMDVSNLGLPSTITDLLNAANGYGKYKINVKLNEELSSSKIDAACKAMEEAVAGVADCTATVQQYGMTDDLTSQLSTGLTIKIYGTDAETLTALSEKSRLRCPAPITPSPTSTSRTSMAPSSTPSRSRASSPRARTSPTTPSRSGRPSTCTVQRTPTTPPKPSWSSCSPTTSRASSSRSRALSPSLP